MAPSDSAADNRQAIVSKVYLGILISETWMARISHPLFDGEATSERSERSESELGCLLPQGLQ